jgi:hypothetical protein
VTAQSGLLFVTALSLAFYNILHVPLGIAGAIAVGVCATVSVASLWGTGYCPSRRDLLCAPIVFGLVSLCVASFVCTASLVRGGPAILYADGTDHLGYAHVGDWMREHPLSERWIASAEPRATPEVPYESFPNLMFAYEPRMGAFAFLGIVGAARGVPSSFAYDPACALLLASATLGVSAVFTRRWVQFVVLATGLSLSHWYEFVHSGYLGKALAYPSILFLIGLFVAASRRPWTGWRLVPLLAVAAGSSLVLSGLLTGVLLVVVGGTVIGLRKAYRYGPCGQDLAALIIAAAFSVAASGLLARPFATVYPSSSLEILSVGLRALDLDGWTARVGYGLPGQVFLLSLALATAVCLILIGLAERRPTPVALIGCPLVLLGVLTFTSRDTALQLTGWLYPAMLCGAASLVKEGLPTRVSTVCVIAVFALLAVRVPHAIAAVQRYTSADVISRYAISLREIDDIHAAVEGRNVLVDLPAAPPHLSIVALVELGRRHISLQWTQESWWATVAAWRGWPLPTYPRPATRCLTTSGSGPSERALVSGPHFAVFECDGRGQLE